LVSSRAHENQYFFAAVDRIGSDPNTSYYGTALIASPYAEDIAQHQDMYAYAELSKDDIVSIGNALPLADSFKAEYNF
jgi:predicted amidohydrolase